jgi:uncharacterized membrane protein
MNKVAKPVNWTLPKSFFRVENATIIIYVIQLNIRLVAVFFFEVGCWPVKPFSPTVLVVLTATRENV